MSTDSSALKHVKAISAVSGTHCFQDWFLWETSFGPANTPAGNIWQTSHFSQASDFRPSLTFEGAFKPRDPKSAMGQTVGKEIDLFPCICSQDPFSESVPWICAQIRYQYLS